MKPKIINLILFIAILLIVAGCGDRSVVNSKETDPIKIGVSSGPHEEIANKLKEVAASKGIEVEVVAFNDWLMPNQALSQGDIDLNVYQTIQFLDQYNEDRKTDIVAIAKAYTSSQGIYSEEYKDIKDIPDNATVGIPNDPINLWRGLLIYESAGLIKLKENVTTKATVRDIEENPKNLKFKELEAGMLAPTLKSLDASIIPSNYAIQHGFSPKEDALFLEDNEKFSTYVAVNPEDKDDKRIRELVELYGSREVIELIQENYEGVYSPIENPFDI